MPFVEIDFSDLTFYERIAGGAAGTVYRGLWKSTEKIVAIKKLLVLEKEVYVCVCAFACDKYMVNVAHDAFHSLKQRVHGSMKYSWGRLVSRASFSPT